MEKRKPGRPKSDKPIRDRSITIRVTEAEYEKLREISYQERITYTDVLLKGLDYWSKK